MDDKPARRQALINFAALFASFVPMFAMGVLARAFPAANSVPAFVAAFAVTAAAFAYCFFFWRARCPHCKRWSARFKRRSGDVLLACGNCNYRGRAGWQTNMPDNLRD